MSSDAYASEGFIAGNSEAAIPLAIVDDYPLLIAGIEQFLASCGDIVVVAQCTRFPDLLVQIALKHPKIILLGCETSFDRLPKQLLAITERDPEAKVIVFTGNQNLEFHEEALRNGARGVILKHCAPELIAKSVRKVHRGGLCFDRSLTDRMLSTFVRHKHPKLPTEAARISSLTERETQIISRISEGLRNKEIAYELHISNATVAHTLTAIYRKLGLADRTELLLYAHRNRISALQPAQGQYG
jgi:two-component system nitrate/nitrite response regulator NarL